MKQKILKLIEQKELRIKNFNEIFCGPPMNNEDIEKAMVIERDGLIVEVRVLKTLTQ